MPALLQFDFFDKAAVEFERVNDDHWSKDPRDFRKRDVDIAGRIGVNLPPAEYLPVEYRVLGPAHDLHDMMSGPGNTLFVSRRVKAMIEEMEPMTHHFLPTLIHNEGKTEDGWFLFKFGDFLDDAIFAEKSEVGPARHPRTREVIGFSAGHSPRLAWRSDVVAGHHLWADRKLPGRVTVSHALLDRFQRAGVGRFEIVRGSEIRVQ